MYTLWHTSLSLSSAHSLQMQQQQQQQQIAVHKQTLYLFSSVPFDDENHEPPVKAYK